LSRGFFRTELLSPESTTYAEPAIDNCAENTKENVAAWKGMNGKQGGDPSKLAVALVKFAEQAELRPALQINNESHIQVSETSSA
jgi:hypothetical protein